MTQTTSATTRRTWRRGRRIPAMAGSALFFLVGLLWPGGGAAQGPPVSPLPSGSRVPVVLVPGWSDASPTLEPLRELLLREGWSHPELEVVSFRDPVGSNRDHAREIGEAIVRVQNRTGARRVDIVAHSMGGLASRFYMKNGGASVVRRAVFIATPHRGTWLAHLAWGEGGDEMEPGSLFLLELDQVRGVPFGVEALTIRSKVDLHIIPPESARLEGVPDVEICCPTHEGLLSHPETIAAIRRFLIRGGGSAPGEESGS